MDVSFDLKEIVDRAHMHVQALNSVNKVFTALIKWHCGGEL